MDDQTAQPQAGAAQAKQPEPDYKALWEEARANSRKWEERAKANREALSAAPSAEDYAGAKGEAEQAKARVAELEAQVAYRDAVARVAEETGYAPRVVEALKGSTAEELRASAEALKAHAAAYPVTRDRGEVAPPRPTREAILAIEDRDERERAILSNIDQF